MCHFVTAVLPARVNHALLAEIAVRHGRALKPLKSPSIEGQLKTGERYFLTNRVHCDCGTALGALGRTESELESRKSAIDDEEQKLRRKGWSAAKINRWKEQKSRHLARPKDAADTTDWQALLTEMCQSGQTPYVGLLLHWYDGPIEGRVELRGRESVKVKNLGSETLSRMHEDVLYEFQK